MLKVTSNNMEMAKPSIVTPIYKSKFKSTPYRLKLNTQLAE